ncbi:two-partner secretion domain-containing protein, partial [Aliarcobacter cryaerophilus]|uniref:two-partner secretion domain-containing protein n=1 Tax=Aliarcobacter cryaerophilus TaxID=28198 RepID=UPI0021B4DEFB
MYYKNEYKNRFRILKGGLISLVVSSNLYGAPSGGTVVSGTATISQNANTTNINQSSNKAVINWQDFSIKSNETVNFNQPNVNSITLNRVIGNEKSIIDGALNANGQVWLINSNGVLFGKNAKVNTAGIVASTKDISNEDFNNGNYNFKGNSTASIVNEGEIKSLANTHATFIANSVTNKGKIEVHKGTINLVGASDVTLTLNENQNLSLKVNKGVLDALVDNQNLIVANGGNVYLTTNAKDELLKGVVNHSGIIEANSLDDLTNNQNEVILFAHGGTANISGEIKAKNSFVETSGKDLNVTNEAKITAKKWLLDPVNVTIDNSNGTIGNEKVGATVIQNALNNNTDIEIQANNNINVNQAITWSTAQELTLNAGNNIYINKEITATNNSGKLALKYGQSSATGGSSDYYVNAKVNLKAGQNFSTQKGSNVANLKNYMVITDLGTQTSSNDGTLQGMKSDLGNTNANYVLGSDIDASETSSWNSGEGFTPIGVFANSFYGTFDGLGHTISNLYINRGSSDSIGLFGDLNYSTIRNLGLLNVDITGRFDTGSLVGKSNNGGIISNSYATGTVRGTTMVGGLVGIGLSGIIENSYSKVNVVANNGPGFKRAGGLAGYVYIINNSYASGTVTGTLADEYKYGLAGTATITNSWYDKDVNTASMVDSSRGKTKAEILTEFSRKDGWITGAKSFEGYGLGFTAPVLPELRTFSTITPTGTLFEGGYGTSTNPYTITNWTQLQNINNSNIVTSNYYFNLLNNLSSSTSDYTNLASNTANGGLGWNSIGKNETRALFQFDGLGNTISDLYINRPNEDLSGLFGHTQSGSNIQNIGLLNVNITGGGFTGGLVGANYYTDITNSYVSGGITGNGIRIGGLAGANSGTISNSYAIVTVAGNGSEIGGLVGYSDGTISNSFYDKTKYTGDGVGNNSTHSGVIGKTTQEMSYGGTFKTADWDIVADSSVTSLTPVIKWDSINNKYVWAIAPLALTYTLADKTTTYNGTTQNLSTFYNNSTNIFGTNHSFIDLSKYKFQVAGNDVTGYKDADIYNSIKLVNNSDSFAILNTSGNTDGKLTINKKDLTISNITANNKIYDGTTTATVDKGAIDYTGKFGSDNIAIDTTNLVATFVDKNVGTHQVNISGITLSGADANNYNVVAPNSLTASITQKDLTISAITANNKTYDGTTTATLSNIGTLVGLVTGEDLTLSNTSVVFSDKNVADGITVTASGYTIADKDSFKASNYNLIDTSKTTTANISKADLTATLNDNSKIY